MCFPHGCVVFAASASLMLVLCGCQSPSDRSTAMSPEALFRLHCSRCHGDGTGNGHIAGTLKVAPRNLKHLSWQQSVDDAHIRRVILHGGAAVKLSPEMPGFEEQLTAREIQQLVSYIRRIGHR